MTKVKVEKKAFHGLLSIYFDNQLVKQYLRLHHAKKFVAALPGATENEKIQIKVFSADEAGLYTYSAKEFLEL